LAGVHTAAELVAAGPERGVQFGFLEGHAYIPNFRDDIGTLAPLEQIPECVIGDADASSSGKF
jgi:hypothetical protein